MQRFIALIPEIRAEEHLDEAMIAMIPHLKQSARADVLRAWTILSRGGIEPALPRNHDQAWDALRSLIRAR